MPYFCGLLSRSKPTLKPRKMKNQQTATAAASLSPASRTNATAAANAIATADAAPVCCFARELEVSPVAAASTRERQTRSEGSKCREEERWREERKRKK